MTQELTELFWNHPIPKGELSREALQGIDNLHLFKSGKGHTFPGDVPTTYAPWGGSVEVIVQYGVGYSWEMSVHLLAGGVDRGQGKDQAKFSFGLGANPGLASTLALRCDFKVAANQPWVIAVGRCEAIVDPRSGSGYYEVRWSTPEKGIPKPDDQSPDEAFCACRAFIYLVNG